MIQARFGRRGDGVGVVVTGGTLAYVSSARREVLADAELLTAEVHARRRAGARDGSPVALAPRALAEHAVAEAGEARVDHSRADAVYLCFVFPLCLVATSLSFHAEASLCVCVPATRAPSLSDQARVDARVDALSWSCDNDREDATKQT